MLQENEETLHKRPIMLSFGKPTVVPTAPLPTSTTTTTATTNTDKSDTTNGEMINNPSVIFSSTTTTTSSSTATTSTTTSTSRPSSPLPNEVGNGLQPFQTSAVIESCVELVSWPLSDPDCLHANLRVILRLYFLNQANKLNEGSNKTESNKFSKSNSSSLIQPNSSTNKIPPIQTQQPLFQNQVY